MRLRAALVCAVVMFAGTAEASHLKVEAVKAKGRHATAVGTAYTVRNDENFPVDICMSDNLTGPEKVEVSPFTLEKLEGGQWKPLDGVAATVQFTYEMRPGWVESYPITVREAGRYRLVLKYGRAAPDGKGCDALFQGLTMVVRSKRFDVP
jgi:hypothetical protein